MPAFSFSPQGWGLDYLEGPPVIRLNHSYHEFAYVDSNDPGETIKLSIEIAFKAGDDTSEYELGAATYIGVYKRDQGQKKFSLRTAYSTLDKHAPIPNSRFEALDGAFALENEETLFYILNPLKRIASAPDAPEKRWLRKFLVKCKNTPEKRAIQAAFR